MRIESAPEANQDNPYLQRVVRAVGRVLLDDDDMEAYVTVDSWVSDFKGFGSTRGKLLCDCELLSKELGVPVKPSSPLVELAEQLKAKEEAA